MATPKIKVRAMRGIYYDETPGKVTAYPKGSILMMRRGDAFENRQAGKVAFVPEEIPTAAVQKLDAPAAKAAVLDEVTKKDAQAEVGKKK